MVVRKSGRRKAGVAEPRLGRSHGCIGRLGAHGSDFASAERNQRAVVIGTDGTEAPCRRQTRPGRLLPHRREVRRPTIDALDRQADVSCAADLDVLIIPAKKIVDAN